MRCDPDITYEPDFCGYTVLHADDMAIERAMLRMILEPQLLDIDAAENGREAVRLFRENPFRYSLIFMDMEMPIMGGCEATRMIRSLHLPHIGYISHARSVPIIAVTANNSQKDIEKCLSSGMNAHLSKPYNKEEILRILEKYLR